MYPHNSYLSHWNSNSIYACSSNNVACNLQQFFKFLGPIMVKCTSISSTKEELFKREKNETRTKWYLGIPSCSKSYIGKVPNTPHTRDKDITSKVRKNLWAHCFAIFWIGLSLLGYHILLLRLNLLQMRVINRVLDVPFELTNLRSRVLGVIACLTCLCALRAWRGYVS